MVSWSEGSLSGGSIVKFLNISATTAVWLLGQNGNVAAECRKRFRRISYTEDDKGFPKDP